MNVRPLMVTAGLNSIATKHRKVDVYQDSQIDNAMFKLHYGDLNDKSNLVRLVQETHPDEIYKRAAQSYVALSSHNSEYRAEVDGMDTLRILKTIHFLGLDQKALIHQAGTSDCYSLVFETPKKEITPFYPRRSDVIAKRYAYRFTVNYREANGMYACNGILFKHESPCRGETFLTRKIAYGLTNITPKALDGIKVSLAQTQRGQIGFEDATVGCTRAHGELWINQGVNIKVLEVFADKGQSGVGGEVIGRFFDNKFGHFWTHLLGEQYMRSKLKISMEKSTYCYYEATDSGM